MTIGIYSIYFPKLDKVYIGQSQNIEQRFTGHKSLFNKGHYNYKMASAHTQDIPEYSILLECSITDLNSNEIYFINEFNSIKEGLNINHGGDAGVPGYSSGRCKNTKEELELAFTLLTNPELTKNQIINYSGVSGSVLDAIISKKRHIWLHEYYPEVSNTVLSNKSNRAVNAQENRFGTNIYLVSPEGIEYLCTNRNKFAKEHNLNSGHLGAVIRKQESQHKGWKLKEGGVNNEQYILSV